MSRNLDHAYDEFLKRQPKKIIKAIPRYLEALGESNFRYGRFAIPTFYKPHILTPRQFHILKRVASTMAKVINTATRLYFEEGHLSHIFRVSPEAADLIRIDPGYSQSVVLSRFDALLQGESLKLIELNCDSPAGAAYTDLAEEALLKDPSLSEFVEEFQLVRSERMDQLLNALLATYEEFGGYENPHIAIVDWRSVRTKTEFASLQKHFEERGYRTSIADPRELKYKGGKLYHKNLRINLVYRRLLFDDMLDRLDEMEDLVRAYRERAICMVNPLRSRLASTKDLLSIMTNPEYDHFFTENENRIKREHILWTRRLADADDFYGRKKIYIIDFLKDEKENLVLKPSRSFGGHGVTIGRETRDEDWNAAIDSALKEDWVIQDFADIPIMTVPVIVNDTLDFAYKKYNYNALVFGGRFAGGFVRLSDESVINVARGGGLIPSTVTEMIPDRPGD